MKVLALPEVRQYLESLKNILFEKEYGIRHLQKKQTHKLVRIF
jgi:hypothetical protein